MKAKLFLIALAVLALPLVGCGPAPTSAPAASPPPPTERPTAPPPPSPTEAATPTAVPPPADTPAPAADAFAEMRQKMVDLQIRRRGVSDEEVLRAMETVPRHEFVPADFLEQAYNDHPLPIGYGQTISQPYIVALMTELLELSTDDKVLEIGTGSGYQAAVLAEITDQVYSIEIIPQLADRAQATFDRLGYANITAKLDDGYWGWEEYAPFEAIIVTAAPDHVPQQLLNQLADGGRLVIPVGPPGGYQSLWLITRQGDEFLRYNWGGVRFVPLTRLAPE